jgi:hypothetical protein
MEMCGQCAAGLQKNLKETMMKPKPLPVLEMCIENGIERGWRVAHKHNDTPDEHAIKDAISTCITQEFYDWFDFEPDKDLL